MQESGSLLHISHEGKTNDKIKWKNEQETKHCMMLQNGNKFGYTEASVQEFNAYSKH